MSTEATSDKLTLDRRQFIQGAGGFLGWLLTGGNPLALESDTDTPSVFDKLMSPFVAEADKRRSKWLSNRNYQEYVKRVDWELNDGRVNFLLYGEGWSNEPKPGLPINIGKIGSHSIFSYHLGRREVDIVSLTHDIRAPEIERVGYREYGTVASDSKIFEAFNKGRFLLQKQVLESATGLSIDYQVVFPDEAMVNLINDCFGTIQVEVPETFTAHAVYFNEAQTKYPEKQFNEGLQAMNGLDAVQFIKAVVIEDGQPDPRLEHNARKPLVVAGILRGMKERALNPLFWNSIREFLGRGKIQTDFDMPGLVLGNLGKLGGLITSPFDGTRLNFMPEIGFQVYIVDEKHGDGGVNWVPKKDIWKYEDPNMELPIGGDPKAEDLLTGYWGASPLGPRGVVRRKLL